MLHSAIISKNQVRKSGLYTLLLANCDATNAVDVQVTGHTVWMNPYVYECD